MPAPTEIFLDALLINVADEVTVVVNAPFKNKRMDDPLLDTAKWFQVFNEIEPMLDPFETSHELPVELAYNTTVPLLF